jgi:hypothetical protein
MCYGDPLAPHVILAAIEDLDRFVYNLERTRAKGPREACRWRGGRGV